MPQHDLTGAQQDSGAGAQQDGAHALSQGAAQAGAQALSQPLPQGAAQQGSALQQALPPQGAAQPGSQGAAQLGAGAQQVGAQCFLQRRRPASAIEALATITKAAVRVVHFMLNFSSNFPGVSCCGTRQRRSGVGPFVAHISQ